MTEMKRPDVMPTVPQRDPLDDLLMRATAPRPVDHGSVDRVLRRLAQQPLPRQKVPLSQWPARLWPARPFDLQWTFAWPRVAALACSAALGFYVGLAGLDLPFDRLDQVALLSSSGASDSNPFVVDSEPLIGARP